jgi:flagellar hook protein FlgE
MALLVLGAVLTGSCADLDGPADPDSVLLLTVTPPSLPADGFTTGTIVAELDPRTLERYRDISFSTTLGSFVGGSSAKDVTLVVAADSRGRATATLRSSTTAGTAVVTAEVRDGDVVKVSRVLEVPFERVPASNVLSINLDATEAPADGATVTNVVARIAASVVPTERTVTFSTTAGSLGSPNVRTLDVRVSTDDLAAVGLISPRETGVAVITATLNSVSVRAPIDFVAAGPDSAALSVSGSFRLAAAFTTKTILRLELFRDTGTVTRGREAVFTATDNSTGREFGIFNTVTPSDSSGVITAEFTPGNTLERGEAIIRAKVRGSNVSAQVTVEVVDP